jgi:threonine dehydratase
MAPTLGWIGTGIMGRSMCGHLLAAGHPVEIQPHSVADGLGAPFAGDLTLAMCQRYLDGIVRVVSVHPLRGYPLVVDVTVQVVAEQD